MLELHSHKATRKAVVEELGRALKERPVPGKELSTAELSKAWKRRQELSAYAAAMNTVRAPLGRSLHWALGKIASLTSAPVIAAPDAISFELTADALNNILEVSATLADAWGPVARVHEFFWFDLADPQSSLRRQAKIELLLQTLSAQINQLEEEARTVALELGLERPRTLAGVERLQQVTEHLEHRLAIPMSWLTTDDLDDIRERMHSMRDFIMR